MKVIQIPFSFHPDPIGGTEVYVEGLAGCLQALGLEVVIAAPSDTAAEYEHDGLRIYRFAVAPMSHWRDLYGDGDEQAARQFGTLLAREHPDLVHLHALTRGASLRLAREAQSRGVPVLFTYHTPTVSCQRGTLMRWGRELCDGRLDVGVCTPCTLNGLGVPRPLAQVVGRLPAAAGNVVGAMWRSGDLVTALRMRQMLDVRHTACRALLREADRVVALCRWAWDLLVLNGVPRQKLVLSRQGVNSESLIPPEPRASNHMPAPIRIAFLGRLDPTKGAHVLVSAVRSAPDLPVTLDVYGIVQDETDAGYPARLCEQMAGDPRIRFRGAIPSKQVVACLREYDALAVPSQWFETGPLVVLEAFAAGTPVLGSNLGGIAELVHHDVDGLLIEAGSPDAWLRALRRFCSDSELRVRLRRGVRPPRTMSHVAADMHELYHAVLRIRPERPGATIST